MTLDEAVRQIIELEPSISKESIGGFLERCTESGKELNGVFERTMESIRVMQPYFRKLDRIDRYIDAYAIANNINVKVL